MTLNTLKQWKPYPTYKPSGVDWLGDIPDGWGVIRIKFSTYVKGRVGWHGLNSKEFLFEGNFYLVTGTDFQGRTINWETCYRITEERYKEDPYIHLKENDILVTKDGTIGKVVQVKNIPYRASVNSGVFVTRPLNNKLYKDDYMFYILTSNIFHEFIELQKAGTTISHLYQNIFENFQHPIPPLPEQEKIAQFLDEETEKIDKLITHKQRLIELLKEKRTALISHAVTKGLNPHVPMKDSGVEWLGLIPEHWEVSKAKFISSIFVPQRNKPELNQDNDGIPWITMDDITLPFVESSRSNYFVNKLSAMNAGSRILSKGCIIASCVGNFGVASINTKPVIINQQLQAYIPNYRKIYDCFFRYFITKSKPYFDRVATATTLVYVNQTSFGELPLPLPSLQEQQKIAEYLDKKTEQIDQLINKTRESIEYLKEYRTALISAAVTGKIDVREWVSEEVRQ